jgi:hypothetical protein
MTIVNSVNSSAMKDTAGTTAGMLKDGRRNIQENALTEAATIRTMSLEPGYGKRAQLSTPIFFSLALERGLTVIAGDSWATEAKELDTLRVLGSVLFRESYRDRSHSIILGGHPKPAINRQLKTGHSL